ncbi:hypothetical protein NL676_009237 [Syzygium grande]|nr:hypothetical protein NL676_009237 [Syzygium grande]
MQTNAVARAGIDAIARSNPSQTGPKGSMERRIPVSSISYQPPPTITDGGPPPRTPTADLSNAVAAAIVENRRSNLYRHPARAFMYDLIGWTDE